RQRARRGVAAPDQQLEGRQRAVVEVKPLQLGAGFRVVSASAIGRASFAERPSSAAGPAGKKSCHEKPFCRPRLLQRLVRRCYSSGIESRWCPTAVARRDRITTLSGSTYGRSVPPPLPASAARVPSARCPRAAFAPANRIASCTA